MTLKKIEKEKEKKRDTKKESCVQVLIDQSSETNHKGYSLVKRFRHW